MRTTCVRRGHRRGYSPIPTPPRPIHTVCPHTRTHFNRPLSSATMRGLPGLVHVVCPGPLCVVFSGVQCLADFNAVIKASPTNSHALFRRGFALKALKKCVPATCHLPLPPCQLPLATSAAPAATTPHAPCTAVARRSQGLSGVKVASALRGGGWCGFGTSLPGFCAHAYPAVPLLRCVAAPAWLSHGCFAGTSWLPVTSRRRACWTTSWW